MTERAPDERPVAVDVMGGDAAPDAIVRGALRARARGVPVLLVGDRARIEPLLTDDVEIVHTPDAIGMADKPYEALARSPQCSILVAMGLLAAGRARGVVSCGNTGAAVIAAVRTLGTGTGVERVALGVPLPTADGGRVLVLDIGASVEARPAHLLGFARMGAAWARQRGVEEPRIALLSNGEERTKGTRLVQQTLDAARSAGLPMAPMEPGPALAGGADVLVTDGFTGNILIKSIEAAIASTRRLLADAGSDLPGDLSWRSYGGAILLGVPGTVVIGHGRADEVAAASAIEAAHREAPAAPPSSAP